MSRTLWNYSSSLAQNPVTYQNQVPYSAADHIIHNSLNILNWLGLFKFKDCPRGLGLLIFAKQCWFLCWHKQYFHFFFIVFLSNNMGDPLWLFMLLWLTLFNRQLQCFLSLVCSQTLCISLSLYFMGLISNTLLVEGPTSRKRSSYFSIKFSKVILIFLVITSEIMGGYSISKFSGTSFHKAKIYENFFLTFSYNFSLWFFQKPN